MKFLGTVILVFLTFWVPAIFAQAQPAAASRSQVAGTVTAVDAPARQVSLKTDKGDAVAVQATERTLILRIPPGETDPKKGTKITVSEVSPGDRVVAVSRQNLEGKTVDATTIFVMSKSDVAQIQQKDQEDWKRRGTTGMVTAIDFGAAAITLKVGQRTVTVQPSGKTDYRRYSLDSARFSDSKPSSLAEIKNGDQVRVLGDKNEDGTVVKAEKIVFGTFRQIAATISSIDPATGEMIVTDLATKKPLTIRVNSDSRMKKLPEMAARMLARRYAPRAPQGGGAGGRGGDIGAMLDDLPAMPLSDLKPGDAIMVTTTVGTDPSRVTATMLLAGVEPLLTASPTATRDIMSGWNLSGGGGEGNQ